MCFLAWYNWLMQTKIEGLILSKSPFQDRHLICRMLLRSGKMISVVCYGGSGGGKNKKGSMLEIGYMMKMELARGKRNAELYTAKEWLPIWTHESIRLNHKAFSLMCFMLEVSQKFAQEADLHDSSESFDDHNEGLFRVVSSSLFFLDQEAKDGKLNINWLLVVFLSKLTVELGIFPDRMRCTLSGMPLTEENEMALIPNHGGFALLSQMHRDEAREYCGETGKILWKMMGEASSHKYQDLIQDDQLGFQGGKMLFHYLAYQFHLKESEFKSLGMLF